MVMMDGHARVEETAICAPCRNLVRLVNVGIYAV